MFNFCVVCRLKKYNLSKSRTLRLRGNACPFQCFTSVPSPPPSNSIKLGRKEGVYSFLLHFCFDIDLPLGYPRRGAKTHIPMLLLYSLGLLCKQQLQWKWMDVISNKDENEFYTLLVHSRNSKGQAILPVLKRWAVWSFLGHNLIMNHFQKHNNNWCWRLKRHGCLFNPFIRLIP